MWFVPFPPARSYEVLAYRGDVGGLGRGKNETTSNSAKILFVKSDPFAFYNFFFFYIFFAACVLAPMACSPDPRFPTVATLPKAADG